MTEISPSITKLNYQSMGFWIADSVRQQVHTANGCVKIKLTPLSLNGDKWLGGTGNRFERADIYERELTFWIDPRLSDDMRETFCRNCKGACRCNESNSLTTTLTLRPLMGKDEEFVRLRIGVFGVTESDVKRCLLEGLDGAESFFAECGYNCNGSIRCNPYVRTVEVSRGERPTKLMWREQ